MEQVAEVVETKTVDTDKLIMNVSQPLYISKGWLKFVGVMNILSGVAMIPSVIGILVCWLPVWMGLLLFKAASSAEAAYNGRSEKMLVFSLEQVRKYFVIQGIMLLVSVLGTVIGILFWGGAIFALISSMF